MHRPGLATVLSVAHLALASALVRPAVRARAPPPVAVAENALAVLGGSLARVSEQKPQRGWERIGPAWVRLPPSATPFGAVHFVGGAGFGSAPNLCYDGLLGSLADRCGVVVVATEYDVGTDHHALARRCRENFDASLAEVRERYGLGAACPIYRLGHSLGAKLLVVDAVSDGRLAGREPPPEGAPAESLALLALNNFELADSAKLAAKVVAGMQGGGDAGERSGQAVQDAFSMVSKFAAASGFALEVSPTPAELEAAVAERYGGGAVGSTAVYRFEAEGVLDELDSSDGFVDALREAGAEASVETLAGTHVSPVFFRLKPADIDPALAMLLGGADREFAIGDAASIDALCDALCAWVWPSGMREPLRLTAAPEDAIDVGEAEDA